MARVSGYARVIKYLLFLFTFLFVITGIILLSLGIALHTNEHAYAELLPSFPFLNVGNLLIVVGVLVFIVSFAGCFGAMRESRCLLSVFIISLVVIFILEMLVGALGYANRNKVKSFVTNDLKHGLDQYEENESYKAAWDEIQSKLMCCGVEKPDDWYLNSTFTENSVPDSCCLEMKVGCGRDGSGTFTTGCKEAMTTTLEANLSGVAAGGIIIALFEIVGFTFGIVLCCFISSTD
ncbi:tetraspanin-4-like isoform X2 [Apostichopus japonicus]|uniref:tetraspanin-4-like isoform X2 n=1 Tax=Stichopus japonicus TaxID=307972 RepID=UPI003AB30AA4